jgi:hypothetical protein
LAAPAAEPAAPKAAPAPPLVHAARTAPPKPAASPRNDVLAAIAALSEEEKIALFS